MLTTSRHSLIQALDRCAAVADAKSAMPILGCCLIDGGTIAATDLYRSVTCTTDATGALRICVSAKDLLSRVKAMPDGPITLDVKDASLVVKGVGKRKFVLPTQSADEYPKLPSPGTAGAGRDFGAGELTALLENVSYAISTDETRPHVNSVLFTGDGNRVVATDGHRLALFSVDEASDECAVLVPLKAVSDLRKIGGPAVTVTISDRHIFVLGADFTYAAKLVDAVFPPYRQVIPQTTEHTVNIPREALRSAVVAVSLASNDRTGAITLSFAKGSVTVSAQSAEGGDATDEVPCDYLGAPKSVAFNARYALDTLGKLTDDEVSVGFGGELDPITWRGSGDAVDVIMPMRQ
jgi:DNA polymerase III subunit beta